MLLVLQAAWHVRTTYRWKLLRPVCRHLKELHCIIWPGRQQSQNCIQLVVKYKQNDGHGKSTTVHQKHALGYETIATMVPRRLEPNWALRVCAEVMVVCRQI